MEDWVVVFIVLESLMSVYLLVNVKELYYS